MCFLRRLNLYHAQKLHVLCQFCSILKAFLASLQPLCRRLHLVASASGLLWPPCGQALAVPVSFAPPCFLCGSRAPQGPAIPPWPREQVVWGWHLFWLVSAQPCPWPKLLQKVPQTGWLRSITFEFLLHDAVLVLTEICDFPKTFKLNSFLKDEPCLFSNIPC